MMRRCALNLFVRARAVASNPASRTPAPLSLLSPPSSSRRVLSTAQVFALPPRATVMRQQHRFLSVVLDVDGEQEKNRVAAETAALEKVLKKKTLFDALKDYIVLFPNHKASDKTRKDLDAEIKGTRGLWKIVQADDARLDLVRKDMADLLNKSWLNFLADDWGNITPALKEAVTALQNLVPLPRAELKAFIQNLADKVHECKTQLQGREAPLVLADCTLLGNPEDVKTVDRADVLREGVDFVTSEEVKASVSHEGRQVKEILATWATTGAGKSHFVSRLCKDLSKDPTVVVIPVSFNSGHNVKDSDRKHPLQALCARLIHSALEFPDGTWDDFSGHFYCDPSFERVFRATDVIAVLRDIMGHEGPIFIGVDEITKLALDEHRKLIPAYSDNPGIVYDAIVATVDNDSRCRILITTLDSEPMISRIGAGNDLPAATGSSGRRIKWLKLKPFSPASVREICVYWRKCGSGYLEEELEWLASVCGGHARSLDFMGIEMRGVTDIAQRIPQEAPAIYEKARLRLYGYNRYLPPADSVVSTFAHSILNAKVSVDDRLGAWSFADLIKHGWLINEAALEAPDSKSVPQIGLLMLHTWSLQYAEQPDSSDPTARLIADFVNTIIQKGNAGDWHAFEQFHASMELLRHWAARWALQGRKQREVDISAWYGEEAIVIKQKPGEPFNLLFEKNEDDALGSLIQPLSNIVPTPGNVSCLPHFKSGSVVLMCANQPAFDSFVMVKTGEGKNGLILIENRFSSDHKKTLTVNEVVGKFDLLTKKKSSGDKASVLATMMEAYNVQEENVVYVIAAMRNLPGYADAIKKPEENGRQRMEKNKALDVVRNNFRTKLLGKDSAMAGFKGTIVIAPRPALKHYYGPTFAQCGVLAVSRFGGLRQSVADEE